MDILMPMGGIRLYIRSILNLFKVLDLLQAMKRFPFEGHVLHAAIARHFDARKACYVDQEPVDGLILASLCLFSWILFLKAFICMTPRFPLSGFIACHSHY